MKGTKVYFLTVVSCLAFSIPALAATMVEDASVALATALGKEQVFVELDPDSFSKENNAIYSYPVEISPDVWMHWSVEWYPEDTLESTTLQINLAQITDYIARDGESLDEVFFPNDPTLLAEFYGSGTTSLCDNRVFQALTTVVLGDGTEAERWVGVELKAGGGAPATVKADDESCPWLIWNCRWRKKKCKYTVTISIGIVSTTHTKVGKCTITGGLLGCWCI